MKVKIKFRKYIACLLIIAITLSTIQLTPVYAADGDNIGATIADTIKHEAEKTVESIEDSKSDRRAGDWGTATKVDHLPWNAFHNAVQADIRTKNSEIMPKELSIEYTKDNGKLEGKRGRADLYMESKEGYTYIWEVKPYSYSEEPKRSLAKTQLSNYVLSNKKVYRTGGMQISSGETTLSKAVIHAKYIEYVTYTITYTNAGDGLIFYQFTRHVDKREPNPETEPAAVPVVVPEKERATSEILNPNIPVPVYIDDNDIDLPEILTLVAVASAWGTLHAKINSNPSTANSVSAAIAAASAAFIIAVNPIMVNAEEADSDEINAAVDDFMLALEVYGGDTILEELENCLLSEDEEMLEALIKEIQGEAKAYEEAGDAQPPCDPLIIDLGAHGIQLHSLEKGVYFDLDNNGFAEKTAWIDIEDGFLALDRNNNGKIDNGGELFGDQVILKDGSKSSSGFEALAEYDENNDGVIDCKDMVFEKLMVWTDKNHNGISEADELGTLDKYNIVSISLKHTEKSITDEETGTRIAETAKVKMKIGGVMSDAEISEFWFPVNLSDTTHGTTVTAGNIPNISQAIADDETGELFNLVYEFSESDDIVSKRCYLKQILYFIADAEEIPVDSRGGNIDARDLKVIEQFMGREFAGVDGTNPNVNAAEILKGIFSSIEDSYYNILNLYAGLGGYLKAVYEYTDDSGSKVMDMSYLNYIINLKMLNGEDVDSIIYDLGVYLKSYDNINHTNDYDEYCRHYSSVSSHYADIVEMSKAGNTYIGTDGDDIYAGTGSNDFILGADGNDVLSGGEGNDIVSGGAGDDTLDGGAGNDMLKDDGGNDIYIFAEGYGNDTIIDNGGSNTIRFQDISSKDILVNGTGENDATVMLKNTSDTLVIKDFCASEELSDFTLEFKDKTMHCTDEDSPFKHIFGSSSDDMLKAVVDASIMNSFGGNDTVIGSDGNDIIYGNEGNDNITSGEGDDTVYGGDDDDFLSGEAGADMIYGENGDDILDGGTGNDFLFGGSGDDTYLFGRDYGTDIIEDEEGISKIKLDDTLSLEDITVFNMCDEAVMLIKDTKDKLLISDYASNSDKYIISVGDSEINVKNIIENTVPEDSSTENIKYIIGSDASDAVFADAIENIIAAGGAYDYIVGGNCTDIIFGDTDADRIQAGTEADILWGGAGRNQLLGEDGDDWIVGGVDNDYICGGNGNDVMIAGKGADFIDGAAGDDIYYFNIGDGNDSIMDSDGTNTIILGDGLRSDSIKAYKSNWNDLLIRFEGIEDSIMIKNYCVDENARNFKFVFADGAAFYAADKDSVLKKINDNTGTEYIPSIYQDGITIVSTDGNDQLTGSDGDDTLIGGAGNNRILGGTGDDIMDGGKGKDYMEGGSGDDVYIYRSGYETDTISDSEGSNRIEISGYSIEDIKAYRTNWNNITIVLDGSGEKGLNDDTVDKIVIEGFYTSETNRNFYLSFDGTEVHATDVSSPLRTIYGTVDSEYMQGFDSGSFTIYGGDGTDTINGGDADDYLYGGSGDDRILGFAGNDVLDGEGGNDYLEGGNGDDTYAFYIGSGVDTINDKQGINQICFGDGIGRDAITAYKTNGNDLTIVIGEEGDKIIIQEYFSSADNRRFDVVFSDGSRYAYDSLENPINQVFATEYDDWLNAWSDEGIYLNGASGNDTITGGAGNDILSGGTGNDTLAGGLGDDIYQFDAGDGWDTIMDTEGRNKIVFSAITSDDVIVTYEKIDNVECLKISVKNTDEGIIIKNYVEDNFIFEFQDGVIDSTGVAETTEMTTETTETVLEGTTEVSN